MRPVLVLRPEPGACATAAAVRALGHPTIVAPLFATRAVPPDPADLDGSFDALLLTSANAVRLLPAGGMGADDPASSLPPASSCHLASPRHPGACRGPGEPATPVAHLDPGFRRGDETRGGDWLAPFRSLPVYAVGQATAAAARRAGWATVVVGEGDAASIVARAAADGRRRLLHLAGREHRAVTHPDVAIGRAITYAADAIDRLPPVLAEPVAAGATALLHSPRAARLFGRLVDGAGLSRSRVALAALSPAVAEAAGVGWASVAAAARPSDAALLAVLPKLCDERAREA